MQQPYRHPCRLAAGLAAAALALAGAWSRASDLPDLPYSSGSTGVDGALSYPAQGEPDFSATQVFDMTGHPDGVWHFTSITIPAGVTVTFLKNAANTPVVWLATDDVLMAGTLNLDGEDGLAPGGSNQDPGKEAQGGPGGFAGGLGGIRYDVSMRYAGTPGQGPGGGVPGTQSGQHGISAGYAKAVTYSGSVTSPAYGNVYVQPLVGGSGGGGQASTATANGYNGGGGGGAILIATSRDMVLSGTIRAKGGIGSLYNWSSANLISGHGSGGAVRLVADRMSGTGLIDVRRPPLSSVYGYPSTNGSGGRIRLEAYYRAFNGQTYSGANIYEATMSMSAPMPTVSWPSDQVLRVTQVDGVPVAQPPTGLQITPDVVFNAGDETLVRVEGTGVPDGTPVWLRIAAANTIIDTSRTANTMTGGVAEIPVTVPTGTGTVQAFANYIMTPVE